MTIKLLESRIMAKMKKPVKPKMGRPPKKPGDKQTACIMVRLTPAEGRRLRAEARAAGLPPATYLAELWRNRNEGGE